MTFDYVESTNILQTYAWPAVVMNVYYLKELSEVRDYFTTKEP
jgi:hypothetical protein